MDAKRIPGALAPHYRVDISDRSRPNFQQHRAHVLVGAVTSLIKVRSWWASGMEMTIVGVVEAAVTYGLGLAFAAIA